MTGPTRENLGIFWEGAETQGCLLYGYCPIQIGSPPQFPSAIWPPGTCADTRRLFGDGWIVWMWEIKADSWPAASDWITVVRATLETMIAVGALVAWGGLEGMFVDPPALFDPDQMGGGVWAALTADRVFFPPPDLDQEFRTLTDDELRQLRVAAGLGA